MGLLGATLWAGQASALTLNVTSARTEPNRPGGPVVQGQAITNYNYLINVDNTGTNEQRSTAPGTGCSPQDPGYPQSCHWTSVAGVINGSWAPVYTQGTQPAAVAADDISNLQLPPGRYLVSVTSEGFKLEGAHFTVPAGGVNPTVNVTLQPNPLPPAQAQALVFVDTGLTNSAYDAPAERGLAGFQGHIVDYIAEVTTDVQGNPICTEYDNAGEPIPGSGGQCVSKCYVVSNGTDVGTVNPVDALGRCPIGFTTADDPLLAANIVLTNEGGAIPAGAAIQGKVKIPNLGPARYGMSVTPPNSAAWVQTTTLEGMHEWDAWVMERGDGLDTEFVVGAEPVPQIVFGFVPGTGNPVSPPAMNGAHTVSGLVQAVKVYVPATGGITLPGTIWGGLAGMKIDPDQPWTATYPDGRPRSNVNPVWVVLTDLNNGDTAAAIAKTDTTGHFQFPNVPAGTYTVTWWDEQQNFILDLVNITVADTDVDMGILPLSGWWAKTSGFVFNDVNGNGKKDAGEAGIPNYPVSIRKRDNSVADRGAKIVTTDANGYYEMTNGYPKTQFEIIEAYDDLHKSTGITYQADNQVNETTVLGSGVDIAYLPIIGLSGRLDWAKQNYAPGTNGGIAGTISYDTTRNELDPAYSAVELWQPGIPELTVNLYKPIPCAVGGQPCDPSNRYSVETIGGALKKGPLLNQTVTETYQPAVGCTARDIDGNPLTSPDKQQSLPLGQEVSPNTIQCLEGPLMGMQYVPYETDQGTADAEYGAAVNGNFGFGDGCTAVGDYWDPTANAGQGGCFSGNARGPLTVGDYLVEVVVPNDALGRPLYKFTREEDINVFTGDTFTNAPPPSCAGQLHQVDVEGAGTDNYAQTNLLNGVQVPASVATHNPDFLGEGGSPYEGQAKASCDTKLVRVSNGRSIAPAFTLFTDVALPSRIWGLMVDDLNFSVDPKSLLYGEKSGVPFAPVGIYDYDNRLVATAETDYNGLYDILLPSTNRINCPSPSGVCANVYRFVGNDPGVPGRLNPNFNPAYRTISADFETLPGMLIIADNAPTQMGVTVQLPGSQNTQALSCPVETTRPQIFAVNRPYGASGTQVTITGVGFGATRGTGNVTLSGSNLTISSWNDKQIVATISGVTGPRQLNVVRSNGLSTVNGLTYHVTGLGYNPTVFEVGPGRTYAPAPFNPLVPDHAIQNALDAAALVPQALVVVYPNLPTADPRVNPRGAYYENPIVHSAVKLQGVGPGGIYTDGSPEVAGSIIDGSAIAGDTQSTIDWVTKYTELQTAGIAGNQVVNGGQVIYVLAQSQTQFTAGFRGGVDGFDLRGGTEAGFPANINQIGGMPTGAPANVSVQAGAVFLNDYAHYFQITNNVVQGNSAAYGTIRVGTPNLGVPTGPNRNDHVRIANNRIIANAGTNLAGAIGIFEGSNDYEVASNDICGNFSAEYGGGVSVYGLSYDPAVANSRGLIHHNRIYSNRSFDEGGGIMIAGELPANPTSLSSGAGPVDIYNNLIQGNLSNDDGGGIRFLMAASDCNAASAGVQPCPINVYNNMIVNNVSTHEGGGVSLNDAPNVRVYNNTIMKNITTATAITSNGLPAPAGLATSQNSNQLQAELAGFPVWSDPLLFNNIFWDNRAGTRAGGTVTGIGAAGDLSAINNWDLGVADNAANLLTPTNSILQVTTGTVPSATNRLSNPNVIVPFDIGVGFAPWRTNPGVIGAVLVAVDAPPSAMGDYHIPSNSQAVNGGAASKSGINSPTTDYDNQARNVPRDIGADEYGVGGIGGNTANLSITKTDGVTTAAPGAQLTYTITATNLGPAGVIGATVTDNVPAASFVPGSVSWTCVATPGSACPSGPFAGGISTGVTLLNGGTATFTLTGTVSATAIGAVANTATIAVPGGMNDNSTANNTATDTDIIPVPLPALGALDSFNRINANNLGTSWSQSGTGTGVAIRVNANQAFANTTGNAYWNTTTFGSTQGAAFTFASAPANNASLVLKATGGTATVPTTYIRVRYTTGGTITVATTTNATATGGTFTTRGTATGTGFVSGDTLSATAYANGMVVVYKTTALGVTTQLATVAIPTSGTGAWTQGTGGGRIGIQLPSGSRVDNFNGGNF